MGRAKHRKRHSRLWAWFLAAVLLLWGGIWASTALSSHYVALQRPPHHSTQPVHVIHLPQPTLGATAKVTTVTQGETLWSIARQYCGNGDEYRKIAIENGISGWVIQPGQKVKVDC